jgi:hypothetical protein
MREPDVVYMLEITEFERPHCRSALVMIRQWPTIYGRTAEAKHRCGGKHRCGNQCQHYKRVVILASTWGHANHQIARTMRVVILEIPARAHKVLEIAMAHKVSR